MPTPATPQLFGAKLYEYKNYVLVDSFIMVRGGDTFAIPRWPALKFKDSDNRWYGYHGTRWRAFLNFGDTASTLATKYDLTQVTTSPAGPNGAIQYNSSGVFAGEAGLTYNSTSNELTTDSAILKKGKIDTIRTQVTAARSNKKAYFFGTSITHGFNTQDAAGALDTARRWSTYVCRSMNWDEVNYGVATMVMQDRTPGAINFLDDRMPFVPTYNAATDTALFFEFGINDATKTGQGLTNYNTTNFITDYSTGIDNATTKGWPTNSIHIIASNWVNPALNANNSQATQDAYYVATKTVATNKSVNLIDLYYYSYNNRNYFFYSDGLHPSNVGHSDYAIKVLDGLNATVYKDTQTIAANGVTELQTVKIKGSDTADIYYRPIALNQSNRMVNLPNGFFIENGPLTIQQGRINMRGFIDVTGTDGVDGVIRGKMLRATGARASVGSGAGLEMFYDGSIAQIYAFDQGAVAWKPMGLISSTFQWNTQGNPAFGFGLDNNAQILSTGNKDGIHFNAVSNNNSGTSASSVFQVGPSGTMGDGLMLRYNGSGYTTSGAYAQATSIIDAGPSVANGLNIVASNASAGIKWFTGGATTGNERMRLTSAGALLINRTSAIGSELLSINGKINANADSVGTATGGFVFRDAITGLWEITGNPASAITLQQAISNGSTLSTTNTIAAGNNAQSFTGTQAAGVAFTFSNSGNGQALVASANGTNIAFAANNSSSGTAVFGSASSGTAGYFSSTTGLPLYGAINPASTNTTVSTFITARSTSSTAAAGLGSDWNMQLEDDAGNLVDAVTFSGLWTSAAAGATASDYGINSRSTGSLTRKFTIKPSGQIILPLYGANTITGTATMNLQVTSAGEVIEKPINLTNTGTLDFTSTAPGASTDLTITVTGAVVSDVVTLGVPNAAITTTGTFMAWVSATNTVSVRFANNDLTNPMDPGSGTFRVTIIR